MKLASHFFAKIWTEKMYLYKTANIYRKKLESHRPRVCLILFWSFRKKKILHPHPKLIMGSISWVGAEGILTKKSVNFIWLLWLPFSVYCSYLVPEFISWMSSPPSCIEVEHSLLKGRCANIYTLLIDLLHFSAVIFSCQI